MIIKETIASKLRSTVTFLAEIFAIVKGVENMSLGI